MKNRIGPNRPFVHLILHSKFLMRRYFKKRLKHFGDKSEVRPYSYIIGLSRVHIGNGVAIRPATMIFAGDKGDATNVRIDDNVLMGSGVHIYCTNHKYEDLTKEIINQGWEVKPVHLKKGCWIGANATILPGVTIGEHSVVGAGSVVTKSVPPNTVVAGVPAKIIKRIE